MKRVTMLDASGQYGKFREEILGAVDRLLASGRWIGGPEVEGLEKELAERVGTAWAVGVASGTDALLLSLKALGVTTGVDVIVPTYTFFATAGAVVNAGGRPIFADVDLESCTLDPDSFSRKVTSKTRVVIPVDLFGRCAAYQAIDAIAEANGIAVLEDAAQAIGASRSGRPAGSFGRAAAFSFYPTKNLGACGDAGLVTTDDEELASRIRFLANHGSIGEYRHQIVGTNSRLDSVQAAILRVKLRHLDAWQEARNRHAALYTERLADHPVVVPPSQPPATEKRVFHQYVIRVCKGSRDELRAYLASVGVDSAVYYPQPLHLQDCFADLGGNRGDCPNAEQLALQSLALPIHPDLEHDDVSRVASEVLTWAEQQR